MPRLMSRGGYLMEGTYLVQQLMLGLILMLIMYFSEIEGQLKVRLSPLCANGTLGSHCHWFLFCD